LLCYAYGIYKLVSRLVLRTRWLSPTLKKLSQLSDTKCRIKRVRPYRWRKRHETLRTNIFKLSIASGIFQFVNSGSYAVKVIIAGSRTGFTYSCVEAAMAVFGPTPTEIVSGHARGVDTLGEAYARTEGLALTVFPANWDYGRGAGFLRNQDMAEYADALVALWDGKSRGTQHMINTARDYNLIVYVHPGGPVSL